MTKLPCFLSNTDYYIKQTEKITAAFHHECQAQLSFEGSISFFRDEDPHSSPFLVLFPRHMDLENDCFHVYSNDKYSETIHGLHSYKR